MIHGFSIIDRRRPRNEVRQEEAMQRHPVSGWGLDGLRFDVFLVYRRSQEPGGPETEHVFTCRAMDYMGYQDKSVRFDADRQVFALKLYRTSWDPEASIETTATMELVVPVEDVVAIVAQERHENYDEPDEVGELRAWPENVRLSVLGVIALGTFKVPQVPR
ncbi:MAG: hypothetical protein UY15_C0037G0006 [Parcubacteria group bacterium GW2011_GWA2_47_9]|uniref:Uncharacterized protein n=2 Tax=Candidatus Wildermuthiibacteriota TaxID=1817923 RepID=A0A1G2R6T7_9BACT|nr:MAG: hypothetical protein UY15_C0037G0006 [Parcubacteria group bacterium GW2011_GWA2_47_9]OHA68546.1 MAG: hypothetical protein A3D59_00770 [Candidatus Wildermuthbacteria bacterium RIFCSPHIGHO2_02_FULL_47_17]